MTANEKLIADFQDLKRMREELDAEIETAADKIKAAMGDADEMIVGPWKVTYKEVTSNRLDSAALKRDLPDIAARYIKRVVSRPLNIR